MPLHMPTPKPHTPLPKLWPCLKPNQLPPTLNTHPRSETYPLLGTASIFVKTPPSFHIWPHRRQR
ncbi:hypothetical protein F442_02874 [Phytophthora nicotianae P10297]|uniref:Uncharacterized protein n=1 Tax=Phytophthora nicotianae P10297 TaxID=1317064 RepID=W2ZYN0_PHYNI|nr:hypothetical protein F442_02874 [Phytophthora nicotianae P10297]